MEKEVKVENIEVLEIKKIKDTPFKMAKLNNGTICVVCGKTKLDTKFESLEECKKWVEKKPWPIIGLLTETIVNWLIENNKTNL